MAQDKINWVDGQPTSLIMGQVDRIIITDGTDLIGKTRYLRCSSSGVLLTNAFMPRVTFTQSLASANNYAAGKSIGGTFALDIKGIESTSQCSYTVEHISVYDSSTGIKPDLDIIFGDDLQDTVSDNAYPHFTTQPNRVRSIVSVRSTNWVSILSGAATPYASYATITPYVSGTLDAEDRITMCVVAPSGANYTTGGTSLQICVIIRLTNYTDPGSKP